MSQFLSKARQKLNIRDSGAALVTVVILMAVVIAIGAVATSLTVTALSMKVVERKNKNTFYDADALMEELYANIETYASNAFLDAYESTMLNYLSISADSDINVALEEAYLVNLLDVFTGLGCDDYQGDVGDEFVIDVSTGEIFYATYDSDLLDAVLTSCMPEGETDCLDLSTDPQIVVDYAKGTFTIQGLRVIASSDDGYESSIDTDIVISCPVINLENVSANQEFFKYAIIAEDSIDFTASNVSIKGNVYSGAGGITLSALANSISLIGETIITRGDISITAANSSMTIGNSATALWAENIIIDGNSSTLDVTGTTYISDDLEVNGSYSTVNLTGTYFGYNYSDDYTNGTLATDAAYSSAIIINGYGSSVDLSNLIRLYVAGRSFISRSAGGESNGSDIGLGESVTVRAAQLAYYVPLSYDDTAIVDTSTLMLTDYGISYYADNGIKNIAQYLDPNQQVVAYYYNYTKNGSRISAVSYYLNFVDEDGASAFFLAYYDSGLSEETLALSESYMGENGFALDQGELIYTLSGNLLYRDINDVDAGVQVVLGNSSGADTSVFATTTLAAAKSYKCLQLTLTEDTAAIGGISDSDVRLTDKTADSMFDYLINSDEMDAYIEAASDKTFIIEDAVYEKLLANGTYEAVVLVDGDYTITTSLTQGLVVATGDVHVEGSFTGKIVSGGTVTFASNATVIASSTIITDLLDEDAARSTSYFYKALKQYTPGTASVTAGSVRVADYMGYTNWTKNKED